MQLRENSAVGRAGLCKAARPDFFIFGKSQSVAIRLQSRRNLEWRKLRLDAENTLKSAF